MNVLGTYLQCLVENELPLSYVYIRKESALDAVLNKAISQPVLAKDYRGRDKWIEATVISQVSPVTYVVELESGIRWKRHIDQLIALQTKIALGASEPGIDTEAAKSQEHDLVSPPLDRNLTTVSNSPATRSPATDMTESGRVRMSPVGYPKTPTLTRSPSGNPNTSGAGSLASPPNVINSPNVNRQTPVRRYPVRERKPVIRLDL